MANSKNLTSISSAIIGIALMAAGAGVAYAANAPQDQQHDRQESNVTSEMQAKDLPPKGARAVVNVSPNPTSERGQEVTLTGHCGGGKELRGFISGMGGKPVLENIEIVNSDPNGFEAKATLREEVGNGVGPVFVDCGDEVGVTLLVTHV
ncbi:hypothetical protein OOZ19_24825 [Saccharopolyspora sp. NFXS83]|uniref:hypothetical protein n=1 Tax=Saccharopolyspora sp. NFXS83 TaxID=2993560 RepID=UPI00224ACA73|nr:hypothetical protein [Saccharopolyspora sp. NFXS83]MCX2733480.1 hypothetical protein [Saccharopolyspora sp. NFXS83]